MRESRICFTILEDGSIPLDGDWMVVGKALGKAVTDQLVAAIEFAGRGPEPRRSWLLSCHRPEGGQSLIWRNPKGPFGTTRCRAPLRIP